MIGPSLPGNVESASSTIGNKRGDGPCQRGGQKKRAVGPSLPPTSRAVAPSCSSAPAVAGPAPPPGFRAPEAGRIRRGVIGPSPRPAPGTTLPDAVVSAAKIGSEALNARNKDENAVDVLVVASLRKGEMPTANWSKKWNEATRRAGLVAAVEAAQMHVIYAMLPRADVWRDSVAAPVLDQVELDRLLQLHVGGLKARGAAAKLQTQEVIRWLLDEGASLEALCAHDDVHVRNAAAKSMAQLGDEAASRSAALLVNDNWLCRAAAAEALGHLGEKAIPYGAALAKLLNDPESVVRMAATATLSRLGSAIASYVAEQLRAPSARSREAAIQVLGSVGIAAASHADELASLLEDSDWQVPAAAASALKRMGAGAAAKPCAKVLARCDPVARNTVCEALVRLGGKEVADAVVPLLSNDEPGVRRHAADCLGQLGETAVAHEQALLAALSTEREKEVKRAMKIAISTIIPRPDLPEVTGSGDELPPAIAESLEKGKWKGKGKMSRGHGKGKYGAKGKGKGKVETERRQRVSRSRSRNRRRSQNRSRSRRRDGDERTRSQSRSRRRDGDNLSLSRSRSRRRDSDKRTRCRSDSRRHEGGRSTRSRSRSRNRR